MMDERMEERKKTQTEEKLNLSKSKCCSLRELYFRKERRKGRTAEMKREKIQSMTKVRIAKEKIRK